MNEVRLIGRLSTPAAERTLPSGDLMAGWRVVVRRPPGPTRCRVDALDCVTFRPDVRAAVAAWKKDATVEVTGELRRRFWRSDRGLASRYEIEAHAVRLIGEPAGQEGGGDSDGASAGGE